VTPIKLGKISLTAKPKSIPLLSEGEITAECAQELSDQAKEIKKQEDKLKDRMDFDCERLYYFSVVFKDNKTREEFCKNHGVDLVSDDFIFADDYEITLTKKRE